MNRLPIITYLFALLFTAHFTACYDEALWQDNPTAEGSTINSSLDSEVVQFPQAIQTYIANQYADNAIISVQLKEDGYEVMLNDGTELTFDLNGVFVSADVADEMDLTTADIPATVMAFINSNYPSETIDKVQQKSNGTYEVRFESDMDLIFSSQWQFLYEQLDYAITPNQLPLAAQAYINAAYPDATIIEAEQEQANLYQVTLSNGAEIYFDNEGTVLYEENANGEWWETNDENEVTIPLNQLPETINNYLASNYADAQIIKAEIEPNGDYEVRLDNGLKIHFNSNGSFLYIETEFQLSVSQLALPDTITIGDTVLLTGYIHNNDPYAFSNDELEVVFGIEDNMPANILTTQEDGAENIGTNTIPPQDSLAFSVPVAVTAARFSVGYDIAVVWPDVPTSVNPIIVGGGRNTVQTYVKLP